MADEHAFLTSLLETVTARLSALDGGSSSTTTTTTSSSSSSTTTDSKAIRAYDAYLQQALDPFVASAQALGGQAVDLAALVQEAWGAQRDFLVMATAVKQPSADAQIVARLGGVQATIQKAQKAIQRNDYENHAKTIAEGLQALSWVVVRPAPVDFIENFVGASDFWGNKVRIQHKKTEPKHVAFVDTFKKLILELMVYVKEHHTVGVTWNPKGVDIDAYIPAGGGGSGGSSSVPAPAPAPAPATAPSSSTSTTADASGGRAGLFSQLGKGLSITSGLKKVSKEQQTWRPEYQQNKDGGGATTTPGAAPAVKKAAFGGAAGGGAKAPKGPPSSVYDKAQFRWNVENYIEGVQQIDVADKNQSVYIYSCGAAIIDIRGKGKSVTLDACKKTQVLVDEMLSSLEVVNCQGVKVQVRQQVPTVAIDKTDGILVILSKSSLGANFLTSKSSEMNIQFPKNEEGELAEMPIPEQWQHTLEGEWPNLRVKNEVSALYSH